ncbi:MAG: ABC transporter ATP-binding protein [Eubacteriales bacterium]|nr:ABC transporter ATP-binding protein [Eubacteriales bacterium]
MNKSMNKNSSGKLPFFGIPYIVRFARPYYSLLLTTIITMAICSIMDAGFPLFQNYALNHFVGLGTLDTLPQFLMLYVLVLGVQSIFSFVGTFAAAKIEVLVQKDIHQECFDDVETMSMSYFHRNSVGYIHSRMIADPERIGVLLSWSLLDITLDVFYMIGIVFFMFRISPVLTLVLLLIIPIEILITIIFQKRIVATGRDVREQNAIITGRFNEGITGFKTIRSLVIGKRMTEEFYDETRKMTKLELRSGHERAFYNGVIVFVAGLALSFILFWGGKLTYQNALLIGTLTVFMNYAISITAYVQALVHTVTNLINTQVNIERVADLLSTEADVVDSPEVIEKYGDFFQPKYENWESVTGDFELEHVTFRYPGTEVDVLDDFSIKIPHGSMTAIVGETGAGKSTIVNLLCRFYEPTSGKVLLDGKDLRERSQLWLHKQIGYVVQEPFLFDDSIRANLCYGLDGEAPTDEQLIEILSKIGGDLMLSHMENGLDTGVGEGGSLLSSGEKQIISFARVLLRDPKIMILDEATSNIDSLTEGKIQEAVQSFAMGRTSIVIAHRLSTIKDADLILVMKQGKVVEYGDHESLLEKNGYYADLCRRGDAGSVDDLALK